MTVIVQASSLYEAAARAMEEIPKANGQVCDLEITQHTPGKSWKVTPQQLARWVSSSSGDGETIGLKAIKHNVRAFLNEPRSKLGQ